MKETDKHNILCSTKEKALIELIRSVPYGRLEVVYIKEGQPEQIDKVREQIKLGK
ncbi:MAG: hypothetical protein SVY53_03215 [Chloroflexota bacterium]|nr:hypothetical protein [Chloroflexota bacterium]